MEFFKRLGSILLALVMCMILVAGGVGIDEVNAASPEPPAETDGTIPMDYDNWVKVNTGAWLEASDGIKVFGAGVREGHQGLQSRQTFNFEGTETRIKWKASGGDEPYAAFFVFLASDYVHGAGNSGNAMGGYFTTDHSWKDSVVIGTNTWCYTRITVSGDGGYTTATASGDYDDNGGSVIYSGSGEYQNADKGQVVVVFVDNYGGKSASIVVGEVITGAASDLEITIETSKKEYQQGEAVVLSGKLMYQGEPIKIGTEKGDTIGTIKLRIDVPFPGADPVRGYLEINETDAAGEFSVMPFAGYNTGEYTLLAKAYLTGDPKETIQGESEPITLQVTKAAPVSLGWSRPPLEQIEKLYKAQIPNGPLRNIEMALNSSDLKSYRTPFPEGYPNSYEESDEYKRLGEAIQKSMSGPELRGLARIPLYGSENNLNSNRFPGLKEFVCGGYQAQVLSFFAGLQFNPDPDVRALLLGLDYGPIARGYGILGGHHAVSLHPINASWDDLSEIRRVAVAFDPWPRQTPEIYSMEEFQGFWGGLKIDPYAVEDTDPNQIKTGLPLTGSGVYVNPFFGEASPSQVPSLEKSSVAVNCPVDVLVTDANGKRVGMLPDGTAVQEFAANVHRLVENGETQGWYFGLNEGSYDFEITGTDTGTFRLQVSGELADGELLDYGEQPITTGERVSINLDADDPGAALILPDGSKVTPTVVEVGGSRGGGEMSRWLLIGIAVGSFLVALGLAVLLKFLPIRARLVVFLVVLLGGLIGGVFGSGHNFADLIAVIRDWSSG